MKDRLNILICPLEWGLGHAARMIAVAGKLRDMNHKVIIGSGEEHLSLFRSELPGISYIIFPGFKPSYSRFLPQYVSLLLKIPSLIYHSVREHYRLKRIIQYQEIDIVISDNRFGLWNGNVTSLYITHMPLIPLPTVFRFLEPMGIFLHRIIIRKYSLCWIPDLPGDLNLTGRLSHGIKLPENTRFIGLLSRFNVTELYAGPRNREFDYNIVILSGPEPQREMLKQKLSSILKDKSEITVMLGGRPGEKMEIVRSGNIHYYTHLPASEMASIIRGSKCVITRSGYTTIMELVCLGSGALLIPTPGQTEQEYLAAYLSEKGWFTSVSQRKLHKGISFPSNKTTFPPEIVQMSNMLLDEALLDLLEKHHKKHQANKTGQQP